MYLKGGPIRSDIPAVSNKINLVIANDKVNHIVAVWNI